MNEVLSIDKLKEMAHSVIAIPGFNGGTINVKAQKPRIMAMAAQGKIPNPLMGVATKLVRNQIKKDDFSLENNSKIFELYCRVCLVEPSYEEMKDIITDDQMVAIFDWAMEGPQQLEPFRADQENGSDNNPGQPLPEETE